MSPKKVQPWKNLSMGSRTLRALLGKENLYKKPEIVMDDKTIPFLMNQFARYKFLHVFLSREVLSRAGRVSEVNF